MIDQSNKESAQLEVIQEQINDTMAELEEIRNRAFKLTTPAALEAAERSIIRVTDKLAGLMTALKIQQAVASEELKAQSSELVKNLPDKLKSQGVRIVQIQPGRGEPVEIAARYYSRKKKRRKKK